MKKLLVIALPALALAACGGDDLVLTNDNNVVLNDSLENFAFSNDDEGLVNGANAMMHDPMMDGSMNGSTTMPMNDAMAPSGNIAM